MWKALAILLVLTTFARESHPQGVSESPSDTQSIAAQITSKIREINRAYESRDYRPFENYYSVGYINIRKEVVYNVREQLIAMLRSDAHIIRAGKKPDHVTKSFRSEDPQIRVYGTLAVANSVKFHEWEYRGSPCTTRFVATDVWVREDSEWKLAVGAANTFHCDPLPWSRPHPAVAALGDRTAPASPTPASLRETIGNFVEDLVTKGSDGRLAPDAGYVDTDGSIGHDLKPLIDLLKAANDPAQRLMIDEEAFHPLSGGAVYTFRSKRRGARGFIERGSVTQHLMLLIEDGGNFKIAAAHSINTVD
jgi:hypothetical protein